MLHLSRDWLLLPYTVIIGAFLYGYGRWRRIDIRQHLHQRWRWGLVEAVMVSIVMVMGVVQQPSSPRPQVGALIFTPLWISVVYGTLDALLLTVVPVLALQHMLQQLAIRHQGRSWAILQQVPPPQGIRPGISTSPTGCGMARKEPFSSGLFCVMIRAMAEPSTASGESRHGFL